MTNTEFKDMRIAKGLSIKACAGITGFSSKAVRKWEATHGRYKDFDPNPEAVKSLRQYQPPDL